MELKDGINECDNSTYHGDRNYLSSSALKLLLEDPLQFYKKYVSTDAFFSSVGSSAMDLGSYVHSLILEPEKTKDEFIEWSGIRRGAEWLEFYNNNKNKIILNSAAIELGKKLELELRKNKAVQKLLVGGSPEYTYCTTLEDTKIKVRADYINLNNNYILDVKTTSKPLTKESLMGSIASLHYDLSAALYVDCFKKINNVDHMDFYFLFVNTKDSLDSIVYKASPVLLNNGRRKYKKAIKIFKECKKSGIWRSDDVEEIDVPFWSLLPDEETP
jgi:hypothetical protein